MWLFWVCLVFWMGASIGSFLLVVLRRTHDGRDWIHGSSVCESCGKPLAWWELIPTVSYLCLRGKCAGCGARIHPSHVLCETYLGLIWSLSFLRYAQARMTGLQLLLCWGVSSIALPLFAHPLLYNKRLWVRRSMATLFLLSLCVATICVAIAGF